MLEGTGYESDYKFVLDTVNMIGVHVVLCMRTSFGREKELARIAHPDKMGYTFEEKSCLLRLLNC